MPTLDRSASGPFPQELVSTTLNELHKSKGVGKAGLSASGLPSTLDPPIDNLRDPERLMPFWVGVLPMRHRDPPSRMGHLLLEGGFHTCSFRLPQVQE